MTCLLRISILLFLVLFVAACTAVSLWFDYLAEQVDCDARASQFSHTGLSIPHRWTVARGCELELRPGFWSDFNPR